MTCAVVVKQDDKEVARLSRTLSVTDPVVRGAFAGKEETDYPLNDIYLCVSLTEPYEHDDRCHKLVAAVIVNGPLTA